MGSITSKVLVVSGNFYEIGRAYSTGLEQLGYDVHLKEFNPWKYRSDIWFRIARRMICRFFGSTWLYQDNIRNSHSVIRLVDELKPDLVVIYKGRYLSSHIIAENKANFPGTRWICWAMDPIMKYGKIEQTIFQVMDAVFYYNKADAKLAESLNNISFYLPAGYNTNQYLPLSDQKHEYQLCFVGNLTPYRSHFIEHVIKYNAIPPDNVRIIIGKWPGLALKRIIHPGSFKNSLWKDGYAQAITLTSKQINHLYNQSEICINVHRQPLDGYGINPRTFEIAGAGGFQLVDRALGIEDLFEPEEEIIIYENHQDAAEKFVYYSNNQEARIRIAENAHQRAAKQHRYLDRFITMMDFLKREGILDHYHD